MARKEAGHISKMVFSSASVNRREGLLLGSQLQPFTVAVSVHFKTKQLNSQVLPQESESEQIHEENVSFRE